MVSAGENQYSLTPLEELHLEKVYVLTNNHGQILCYLPIKVELLDQYLDCYKENYSGLCDVRNTLGSFFKYLHKKYGFPNIMRLTKYKRKDNKPTSKQKNVLSRHDILRLLQVILKHAEFLERDLLLFSLLLSTGCRISEVLNLRFCDIDFSSEMFYLRKTKTKVERTVVLRRGMGQAIYSYCKQNNISGEHHVFSQNQAPLDSQQVRKLLNSYLDQANLIWIRIHDLRHTFATVMYEAETPLLFIKQLLGHEGLQSTQTYVHGVRNMGIVVPEHKEIYRSLKEIDYQGGI